MAVVGAGLSAPSGVLTFRHEGANWRGIPIKQLSEKSTWDKDPGLIWTYTEDRRQLCRAAQPNAGHWALAELARAKPGFFTDTQNIDGLSQRAEHNPDQLVEIHGSAYGISCSNEDCGFTAQNPGSHSTVPGLEMIANNRQLPLLPGVTLFGEKLPPTALTRIDNWLDQHVEIDLLLVIGTTRYPFVPDALQRGAKLAVFNMGTDAEPCNDDDWVVDGDCSQTLPFVIGKALGIEI